jgi:molybdopterin converting factor small subunit
MIKKEIEIEILLFGAAADAVGARRIRRSVSTQMNASRLIEQLKNEFPNLAKHKLLLSINQEYATGDETIREGEEIAMFTAVSGG